MHESQSHEANCFLTLTYSDDHLPPGGTLNLRDWQLFAKRFRKSIGPFRFFHCGEYGEQTRRPHYHAAIFGHDFYSDRKPYNQPGPNQLFTSAQLSSIWTQGHALIGSLTFDSAAYVARYITKKVTGDKAEEHYAFCDQSTGEINNVKPEYCTMSRRPGIGADWFAKYGNQVYPRDSVITNGHESLPPKFYDNLLERENPTQLDELKTLRKARAETHKTDHSPRRLHDREVIASRASESFAREPTRKHH